MRKQAMKAVLFGAALSGCATYSLGSVRPTYSDPHLEVSCAAFPNDKAEINSRLAALYEEGWRIAASGSKTGAFVTPEAFICFERPAGMEPVKPAKAKPAAKPAPPPAEEEVAPAEEEAPKAPPAKKTKKVAPPAEESSTDEAAEPAPKPAPKKRKPVLDE